MKTMVTNVTMESCQKSMSSFLVFLAIAHEEIFTK